jgi:hypothetical protein
MSAAALLNTAAVEGRLFGHSSRSAQGALQLCVCSLHGEYRQARCCLATKQSFKNEFMLFLQEVALLRRLRNPNIVAFAGIAIEKTRCPLCLLCLLPGGCFGYQQHAACHGIQILVAAHCKPKTRPEMQGLLRPHLLTLPTCMLCQPMPAPQLS